MKKVKLSVHCKVCYKSFENSKKRNAHMKLKHADSMGHIHGIRHNFVGGPGKLPYSHVSGPRIGQTDVETGPS